MDARGGLAPKSGLTVCMFRDSDSCAGRAGSNARARYCRGEENIDRNVYGGERYQPIFTSLVMLSLLRHSSPLISCNRCGNTRFELDTHCHGSCLPDGLGILQSSEKVLKGTTVYISISRSDDWHTVRST